MEFRKLRIKDLIPARDAEKNLRVMEIRIESIVVMTVI